MTHFCRRSGLAVILGTFIVPFVASASILGDVITKAIGVVNLVLTLLFVLALAVFAWGIVRLIAAAGNPDKRKDAKGILWWGVIAIAVMASLMGLVRILQITFGTGTEGVINVPLFDPIDSGP